MTQKTTKNNETTKRKPRPALPLNSRKRKFSFENENRNENREVLPKTERKPTCPVWGYKYYKPPNRGRLFFVPFFTAGKTIFAQYHTRENDFRTIFTQ